MKTFTSKEEYYKYREGVSKRFSFWTYAHFSNEIAMGLAEVTMLNSKHSKNRIKFIVNPYNESDICKTIRISKNAKVKCGQCHKENAIACITKEEKLDYKCYLGLCNIAIPIARYDGSFLCVLGGQMIPSNLSITEIRRTLNDLDIKLNSMPINIKNRKISVKRIEELRNKTDIVFNNINNISFLKNGFKKKRIYRDQNKLNEFLDKLDSTKDIYEFSNIVVEQACDLIGASRASIFLKIPNTNLIVCTGSNILKNYRENCLWYTPGEGATGYVFEKETKVVINDLKNYKEYSGKYPGFHWKRKHGEDISLLTKQRQFLGVPIIYNSETIGVVRFPGLITGGDLKEIHGQIIFNFLKRINFKIFEKQNNHFLLPTNSLLDLFSTVVVKYLTDKPNTQSNRNLSTIGLLFSNNVNLDTFVLVTNRNNRLKYKLLCQSDPPDKLIANKNSIIKKIKNDYLPLIKYVSYKTIFESNTTSNKSEKKCIIWPLYAKRKLIGCFITCAAQDDANFIKFFIYLTQSISGKFVSKIDNRQNDILKDFVNEHLFLPAPPAGLKSLADYICKYYKIADPKQLDILLFENQDNNISLVHHWGGGPFKRTKFLNSYLLPFQKTINNPHSNSVSPFKTKNSNRIEQFSAYIEPFINGNGRDQRVGGIEELESSMFVSIPINLPTEHESLIMTVWFHSSNLTFDFSENFLLLVVNFFAFLHYENIKPLKKLEKVSLSHILKGGGPLQWLAGLPAHEFKNLIDITLNKINYLARALEDMGSVVRPAIMNAAIKSEINLDQIHKFYLRYLGLIKNLDGNLESSQSYSIINLLDEIADLIKYEKGVNVKIDGKVNDIFIQVNKSLFSLVIVSLIKNSIDAYNDQNIRKKDIILSVEEFTKTNEVLISVSDFAGGFITGNIKTSSHKTGAGLLLCEHAVSFMGGRFEIDSQNKSTIAKIHLRRENNG